MEASNLSFLGVVLVLELDLFFSCFVWHPCLSGSGFPLVFLLGGVCSSSATEVTSEVRAPELCLSLLACCNSGVRVFGELFSICFYDDFYHLDQHSHFVYKLGNHLGFCGCTCFMHITALFFGCWDIFFCHFHIICSLYHPSCFWVGDILSMF